MDVCLLWVLCVLSGRGLCDELITRSEESYRLWCVVMCDLETSWIRRSWPNGGLLRQKQNKKYPVLKGSFFLTFAGRGDASYEAENVIFIIPVLWLCYIYLHYSILCAYICIYTYRRTYCLVQWRCTVIVLWTQMLLEKKPAVDVEIRRALENLLWSPATAGVTTERQVQTDNVGRRTSYVRGLSHVMRCNLTVCI